MSMNEHIIFQDIPGGGKNGKFHSAILTTYSIDLIHFDSHLRNVLHSKQICSINIFADKNQFERSLDYVNPSYMSNIGKDYVITTVGSIGAFHPKINFFVGDNAVLVVLGSGNLTVPGHGKNHETFSGFMIDDSDESQRPLVEECWRYITRLAEEGGEYEKRRILQEIPENCKFLDSNYEVHPHKLHPIGEDLDVALLYNEKDSSILAQIAGLIPFNTIRKVTIASPFFDEDGETLNTLASLFSNATIEVLIQESCSLPPYKMKENKQVRFLDFDQTKRGKCVFKSGFDRLAHTKVYVFESDDTQYCIIGSANATKPGLGTLNSRGVNDEICILYRSSSRDFLSELGLKTRKKCFANPKDMPPSGNRSSKREAHPLKILSASYLGGTIQIEMAPSTSIPSGSCILLDDGDETTFVDDFTFKDNCITLHFKLNKHTFICGIANDAHQILSNKVFINRIEQLDSTNPSKSSRSINRFISRIEEEGYDGLEISDMLTDVMWEVMECEEEQTQDASATKGGTQRKVYKSLPDIDSNPELNNDEIHYSHNRKGDKASRLLECIEESIRKRLRSEDEERMGEEESGNTESSNERDVEYDDSKVVDKKFINTVVDKTDYILEQYRKVVRKRTGICRSSSANNLIKDDFNLFGLAIFAAVEICYLNRLNYDFSEYSGINKSIAQKNLYDKLNNCMERSGMAALHDFTLFCKEFYKKSLTREEDYLKKARRGLKYAILFATLITRSSAQKLQYFQGQLYGDLKTLFTLFGKPDLTILELELEPLIERYNHIFVFRDVKRAIGKLLTQ